MDHFSARRPCSISRQPEGDVYNISVQILAGRRSHALCKRVEFLPKYLSGPVGAPLDADDRLAQGRERAGGVYWEAGALACLGLVEVCAVALQGGVELVEEWVVDDADDGLFLVQEADGDARKGEAVHEVCSPIWGREASTGLEVEITYRLDRRKKWEHL